MELRSQVDANNRMAQALRNWGEYKAPSRGIGNTGSLHGSEGGDCMSQGSRDQLEAEVAWQSYSRRVDAEGALIVNTRYVSQPGYTWGQIARVLGRPSHEVRDLAAAAIWQAAGLWFNNELDRKEGD